MAITSYIDKSNQKQYKSFNSRTGISQDKDKLYLTILDNKEYFNKRNTTFLNFEYFLDKLEVIDSKYNSLLYHQSNILRMLNENQINYGNELMEAVKKGLKIRDALNFSEISFEFEAFFMQLKGGYENTIRLFYWFQNRNIEGLREVWKDKTKNRVVKFYLLPTTYQDLLNEFKNEIDLVRHLRDFFSHYSDMQKLFLEISSPNGRNIDKTIKLPKEEYLRKGTYISRFKLKIPEDYMDKPHFEYLNERYEKLEGFIIKTLRIIMDICSQDKIKISSPKPISKP